MSNEQRKATDVLLDLESKINSLTGMLSSQSLAINILSNKLNILIEAVDKKIESQQPAAPKFSIESSTNHNLNVNKTSITVNPNLNIPVESAPVPDRRVSRTETYAANSSLKNDMLAAPASVTKEAVAQLQKPILRVADPDVTVVDSTSAAPSNARLPSRTQNTSENKVSIHQKVINKDGKSIFLADVYVTDNGTKEKVYAGRTGADGNWSTVLLPGIYKVVIKKHESLSKQKMESTQLITVVSGEPVVTLKPLTMKI